VTAPAALAAGGAAATHAANTAHSTAWQTLLFSATQTQSVQALARLSLRDPVVVSAEAGTTPDKLVEVFVKCELDRKLDLLYSFVKSHTSSKVLVFFSSCKQVRYVYETFKRFRPGVPLMSLFGKQKQARRTATFNDFGKKKVGSA
jgi:ATP-dependent RNA helicase DDX10/DBP4